MELNKSFLYQGFINKYGITLIETLIGMMISSIIMASMYQSYISQQKSFLIQDRVSEMQQILRASLYSITSEIQMAGYNPTGNANPGFVANFPSPNDTFGATTSSTVIAFTLDNDSSGSIDDDNSEQIAYRINNGYLERFIAEDDSWRQIAENIETVNFVYLDANNNATNVLPDIRSVEISLLVRSRNPDPSFENTTTYQNNQAQDIFVPAANDHYRRRLLVTRIKCRNIGL